MQKEWKVQDLLSWTKNHFEGLKITEPRLEAEVLLAHALKLDRLGLYVQYDRPVNMDERAIFREMIKRRIKGEPTAYITGQREFMSLPFSVDERVLIPRSDTEALVEESIRLLRGYKGEVRVLDVGTGSGAIAVSIAKYVPNATVWGVDISREALEVAENNAILNGVEARVVLIHGHLLEEVSGPFELIVANLPYIPSEKISHLPPEIRDFEPRLALDGGVGGLVFYQEMLPRAFEHLTEFGFLLLEVGDSTQAQTLCRSLGDYWSSYYVLKDLGHRDRILVLKKEEQDADFVP